MVIHLHPRVLEKIKQAMKKHHYKTVEEFIIDAIAMLLKETE
ncbi:MAG: hypothetical protein QW334_00365 [Thermofilum sp.]